MPLSTVGLWTIFSGSISPTSYDCSFSTYVLLYNQLTDPGLGRLGLYLYALVDRIIDLSSSDYRCDLLDSRQLEVVVGHENHSFFCRTCCRIKLILVKILRVAREKLFGEALGIV